MSLFELVAKNSLAFRTNENQIPLGPPRTVAKAQRKDCDQIFELINAAFKIEIGKTGIAYRKCDKYRLKDSARKHLEDMWVVKESRRIVGVVRGVTHNGVTEIGPIAVHPDYQGKGVGRQLMTTVESRAKGGKCTAGIVSCRTDVIPFFEHMGYEKMISKSIKEVGKLYPEDFDDKVVTRHDLELVIMMKKKEIDHF